MQEQHRTLASFYEKTSNPNRSVGVSLPVCPNAAGFVKRQKAHKSIKESCSNARTLSSDHQNPIKASRQAPHTPTIHPSANQPPPLRGFPTLTFALAGNLYQSRSLHPPQDGLRLP